MQSTEFVEFIRSEATRNSIELNLADRKLHTLTDEIGTLLYLER